ncbi:extracellular solute-binding protein family 1 [Beutenbergia cavernae DSM 12333]|uniref:Extracellular solute-binding protein family 1 n=1 Tax=Beutenbergia cavernae (strain ATCC BAA-8 / DSM 12333 / CCUG 43141 / JCM 11478 / NBRC 16432 / NCIMB 13614 / HKI 0122) TaxID=471853 RepID=C5BYW7_BEUC1|nr:ABC transporter substrate-binding protein [Beutenbergia cavernae]ACQ81082.1 extracellular solute-binding protein family 1 [Beutenbergia cavernae DSM 12333]
MRTTRIRASAGLAGTAALALVLAACSSGGGDDETPDAEEPGGGEEITLTVSTFNDFGYTDELLALYEEENPGITVEHVLAARAEDARANLTTNIAAGGEGLSDIEAIELDWWSEFIQYPDNFADLSDPSVEGRWLESKTAAATTEDGRLLGYGTDTGPQAICYRADLFEAAGLPTDRAEVAELLGGEDATWETYFEVGREFVANSESAWFDVGTSIYQGMVNQIEFAYEEADGTPIGLTNPEVREAYDAVMQATDDGLSAGMEQWQEDWTAGWQSDAWATQLCPPWMQGPIEGNAAGVEGWDIADVFPGGGGNWGGSYLTVPAGGEHVEEAIALANWLTSPETQVLAFQNAGTFPSQVDAYTDPALTEYTNPFFNDAPAGEIFSNRALGVDELGFIPFKGPNYFAIHQTVQDAILRVDVTGEQDAETAWQTAEQAYTDLGL